MRQVTIEELGLLLSETREPMPVGSHSAGLGAFETPEWAWLDDGGRAWQPRHAYATDDAAALRLFDELPFPRAVGLDATGHICDWKSNAMIHRAKTRPVAICLAWLAWRGVNVEVFE